MLGLGIAIPLLIENIIHLEGGHKGLSDRSEIEVHASHIHSLAVKLVLLVLTS